MNIKLIMQGLALTTMLVSAQIAHAASFNLCTGLTTLTMPDTTTITMWGYGIDNLSDNCDTASIPGPQLTVPISDTTLTINLRNTLPDATSIIVPGLSNTTAPAPVFFTDSNGRQRARAMTHEAAATVGTALYSFNASPGTYLYHSGSHPAVQVQMGLYGGIKQDAAAGQAYPGVLYDNEVILLYSEVDPALHTAVSNLTYGTLAYPTTINYVPKYFLVNGEAYIQGSTPDFAAGTTGQTTLLRFINAGLESHAPTLQSGTMDLVSEYGSLYPYSRKQSSFLLAAGQTKDALFKADYADRYAIFDRRLRLTNNMQSNGGLISFLNVTPAAGNPIAVPDAVETNEDVSIPAVDLGLNDTDAGGLIDLDSIFIPFQPSNGTVVVNNNGTGTVSYTPNSNFNGLDTFKYIIRDNLGNVSNLADVDITVNPVIDPPVAATLIAPSGDIGAVPNPDFTWNAVAGATDYRLWLRNDSTNVVVIDTLYPAATVCTGTPCVQTSPVALVDGNYRWLIRAKNGSLWGPNSSAMMFSVGTPPAPPTGATLVAPSGDIGAVPNPDFTWNAVAGATDYRLWLRNDSTGVVVIDTLYTAATVCTGTSCVQTSPVALVDGDYRWLIRAKNGSLWGPNSSAMMFSVGTPPAPPVAATLVTPSGDIGAVPNPDFTWYAVANATDYRLWLRNDSTGVVVFDNLYPTATVCSGTPCAQTSPIALVDGNYRWFVRAKNGAIWGPNSSVMMFSVGTPPAPPVAATLIAPSSTIGAVPNPDFTWDAVVGVTDYRLWLRNDSTGVVVFDNLYPAATVCSGANCVQSSPASLVDGNYRWFVRAKNGAVWGPNSSVMMFVVNGVP